MQKAIVLFSGGQDSSTCLLYALRRFTSVCTIGFSYGQRHSVEMDCRTRLLERLRQEQPELAGPCGRDVVVGIPGYDQLACSALTGSQEIAVTDGLPTTFVPARNLLFLCYAAALAYGEQAGTIICGVSETDYSGYPDCRRETIERMQESLSLGLGQRIVIETPLMDRTKGETWQLAEELGGSWAVQWILHESHTCYRGERKIFHPWGYGCGTCPSCVLRKQGWEEYQALLKTRRKKG